MEDQALLVDLVQMVNSLVEEFGLEETGYRLIVNGGKYQEVPQLHWHLVAQQPVHSR
jgi:diadenosine tetraphosphate (Ap4A) HIT family hydrolase